MKKDVLAFHYTSQGIAEAILDRSIDLTPTKPLIRYNGEPTKSWPDQGFGLFCFSFMETPQPQEWRKNNKRLTFPYNKLDSWSTLMGAIIINSGQYDNSLVVLAFQLVQDDAAHVVDWAENDAVVLGKLGTKGFPPISEEDGWINYANSAIKVEDYSGNYLLPKSHATSRSRG